MNEGKGIDMKMFSVIVVSLNSGEKLNKTIDSILGQKYENYEIVVKDGMSVDGSIEGIREDVRLRVCREKDAGIYDAMNQALDHAEGRYILFLNCGDTFYDKDVLLKAAEFITNADEKAVRIIYGDTYCERTQVKVHSAPKITGFTCYRNIPCHQSCFYNRELFVEKRYDTELKIRADYDHFLWCIFKGEAEAIYMDLVIASYEGDGFSENPRNAKRDKEEHELIVKRYMNKGEIRKYRFYMLASLAPVRRYIAETSFLSGMYHWVKDKIYNR